ncbi:MAG: flagellar protein FliJ [Clostridiales bacterium]|jgi:flagellar FliJ protein|nr:flagellar protein FliJ [Clostridiales bacterium]MDK2932283.1 flagellar protein FliJ [Clostridiales bacterium]
MPKFSYRFQSLLNVKRQFEDEVKNELAKKVIKLNKEQAKLESIDSEKNICHDKMIQESTNGININKLCQYNNYLFAINNKLKRQKESVGRVSQDVNMHREKLIKISKEKKILQTLKDKRLQEYLYNQLKIEEKKVEEINNYRYIVK